MDVDIDIENDVDIDNNLNVDNDADFVDIGVDDASCITFSLPRTALNR